MTLLFSGSWLGFSSNKMLVNGRNVFSRSFSARRTALPVLTASNILTVNKRDAV